MNFSLSKNSSAYFLSIVMGTLFLVSIGSVKIYLPGYPIPWVFQNTAALFVALLSPAQTGFVSVALMLLIKSLHLANFGVATGYFLGYLVACAALSVLPKKDDFAFQMKALLLGSAIILFCGWGYLSCLMGLKKAFEVGVKPFLISEVVKIFVGQALFFRVKRAIIDRR